MLKITKNPTYLHIFAKKKLFHYNYLHMTISEIYPKQFLQRSHKEALLKQKAKVIWFLGLSGAGKSELAFLLEKALYDKGFLTQVLDGDNLRSGLNNNLGFSEADRKENIRRAAEVAKILMNCGVIVIASFISPTNEIQKLVRDIVGEDFVEIFLDCPLEICEQRDVKGLYAKARAGIIKNFTGIDSPFEKPICPDLVLQTHLQSKEECLKQVLELVLPKIAYP
ncbi:MAG: adenylyl-sulfate kinase [Raineya sp.]|nr:adenylyl-sulfate kinase [Raineya sp.]